MATVIEQTGIEWVYELTDQDIEDLCQATEEGILDGNGFGWLTPPPRRVCLLSVLRDKFRSVPLVSSVLRLF